MNKNRIINLTLLCVLLLGQNLWASSPDQDIEFYSKAADEYRVEFSALFRSEYKKLEDVKKLSEYAKRDLVEYSIKATTQFLFGPLTHRSLGGEQKGVQIQPEWTNAFEKNGSVYIPYNYLATWMISKTAPKDLELVLPLPYNSRQLRTPKWTDCTDDNPDHQDYASLWYYWDPQRYGCDHVVNEHFQFINPQVSNQTTQTVLSYPEYQNMIRDNQVKMTFAFGYVEDPENPNPFKDQDYGMGQFRAFLVMVRTHAGMYKLKEDPILENKYVGAVHPQKQIGTKFSFLKNGIRFEIKVVASADIDQMELFAQSFSGDHDAFFGWFGHSRVGNGFDAYQFSSLMRQHSDRFSLVSDYQMIYWAGCNSYSYYTKPFFDFKANLIEGDKAGTKSLDIISNGLPSYFSLNASNAEVLLKAVINLDKPTSYQSIVDNIERKSNQFGITVLVNILGDEDNIN